MAYNIVERPNRSKRAPRVLDDFDCGGSQVDKHVPCSYCNETFTNKKTLVQHTKTCVAKPKPTRGTSFFRLQPTVAKPIIDNSNKTLPASQPLKDISDDNVTSTPPNRDTTSHADDETTTPTETIDIDTPPTSPTTTSDHESTIHHVDETTDASDHEEELETDVQITVINNENTQTISVVENIQENLPEYTSINQTPNKTYNNMDGTTFNNLINKFYDESVKFRKNLFLVPTGNSGKEYVKLLTEWMTNYNSGNTFHGIAMKVVMKVVMTLPNLLLQKPSAKSKAKEHTAALERRLRLWREGELTDIWKECVIIQKKLTTTKPQRSQEDISRTFSKLMFEGKVGPALRFLEENADNAVLSPTNEVIAKLQALHPASEEISPNTLIAGPLQPINTAYLLSIDEEEILKAANRTTGSAGPSMPNSGNEFWSARNIEVKAKTYEKLLQCSPAK